MASDGESDGKSGGLKHTVTMELVDRGGFVLGRVVKKRSGDPDHKTAAANAVSDVLSELAKPWLACEIVDRHGKFSPGAVRSERVFGVRAEPE